MHIRSEHQSRSTRVRMKRLFNCRSGTTTPPPAISPSQSPLLDPNPTQNESVVDLSISPAPDASNLGLRNLIPSPGEIEDSGPTLNEAGGEDGPISLEDLFNFATADWINLHNDYAKKYLDDELELCELLNQDAETEGSAEVDVDEMTGDILMS